ncbi:MAG: endonuclease [Maribacter sp.]
MKKFQFLIITVLFFSCSSDNGTNTPEDDDEPKAVQKPIAVNDLVVASEDEDNEISGLLTNDTVSDKARITSYDETTTEGGSITDNRDGTYLYQPAESFSGEDTFTYTICDDESTPNCSIATVTITVEDEGSPSTSDDSVATTKNNVLVIENLIENDMVVDDASYFSVDSNSSSGLAVLDSEGKITYTPATDFTGQDTFQYTICDDDNPTATCSTATVTVDVLEAIALNIPTNLEYYYGDLGLTENSEVNNQQLKNHTISNHTTILSYGQRHEHLYNADADLTNSDNVTLMYSAESRYWEEYTSGSNAYSPQTFNTEHVYPQSLLSADDAVTDLHHLRACDAIVNEDRLNFPFIEGTGSYGLNGENWYPGDEWKGDVARMILYLSVRYNEDISKVGTIDLFLKWNVEDPVSSFEMQRNSTIEGAQGNRNPFIDNPYLATLIWGGDAAENKWE